MNAKSNTAETRTRDENAREEAPRKSSGLRVRSKVKAGCTQIGDKWIWCG